MVAVLSARRAEDEELMKTMKAVKEKAPKKKMEKGYRTVTAIKLLPGDIFIRDINLVQVQIQTE